MLADIKKCHKMSPVSLTQLQHHIWQGIQRIRVIRCPPNSTPQGDKKSKQIPNVKKFAKQTPIYK